MKSDLWYTYAANGDFAGFISDLGADASQYPTEILFYFHAMIDQRRQCKKYHFDQTTWEQTGFEAFLRYYAGVRTTTINEAEKYLYNVCFPPVARHTTVVFNRLLKQYELDAKTLARVFGFRRTDFVKIVKGERGVSRDLLMGLCMFLEFDLEKCEEVLADCGIALSKCLPDCVFKKHISNGSFNLGLYTDDVFKVTKIENEKLKALDADPITLPSFFRGDRSYPEASVSDYFDGEHYDYKKGLKDTAKDFLD